MKALSRRNAFSLAGKAVGAPADRLLQSIATDSQRVDVPTTKTTYPTYSKALETWTIESVARSLGHLRRGNAYRSHFRHTAGALHLYAKHLEDLHLNSASKVLADHIDVRSAPGPDIATINAILPVLQKYDATWSQAEVVESNMHTSHDLQNAKASLIENGLTWHLHLAADVFTEGSYLLPHAPVANALLSLPATDGRYRTTQSALFSPAYYDPRHRAHLQTVSACSVVKHAICKVLTTASLRQAVSQALIQAVGQLGANAFCGIDLVTSVLADVASEGLTSIASPLEVALCAAAQSPYAKIGIGAVVGQGLSTLQSTFGC